MSVSVSAARSSKDSHLSDPRYGFDFVVASTQGAINATMAHFLRKYDGQEIVVAYSWTDENKPQLVEVAPGTAPWKVDPFAIPDGAPSDTREVSELWNNGFAFAFRARLGVPSGMRRVPDVVVLDRGPSMVTYRLFFAEFEVATLEQRGRRQVWQHLVQPAKNPWIFTFSVALATYEGTANKFSSLPEAVRNRIKNTGPDAFSIQQLYLDLNTPGLQDTPTISNLDPSSDAAVMLQKVFVNLYWRKLKDGGSTAVALGYTVKPTNPDPSTPSIQPRDIAKSVSVHTGADGQPAGNGNLNTLDYLCVAGEKRMPPIGAFGWNWVSDPDNPPDGVIAVNRDAFAEFVGKLLSKPLRDRCIQPKVRVYGTAPDTEVTKDELRSTPAFALVPHDGRSDKVLSFSYTSEKVRDELMGWGFLNSVLGFTIEMQTFTESHIWFRGNSIDVQTTFRVNGYFSGFAEDTKVGDIVNFRVDSSYLLGALNDRMSVTPAGDPKRVELGSTRGSKNVFEQYLVNSSTGRLVNDTIDFYKDVESYLTGFAGEVAKILNGPGWVFPGGNTFTFKDVRFSDHQDLLSTLTYREITNPPTGR